MTHPSSRPVPSRGHTQGGATHAPRVLIVEGGLQLNVTQLLRDVAHIRIEVAADLYTALALAASNIAIDPVRAVFVHPHAEGFDLAAVPAAFRRINPSIDTVLIADRANAEAVSTALECGFEAILLPPHDSARVSEVLAAVGLVQRTPAHAQTPHAEGQRLVELAIEHAREQARDRDDMASLGLGEAATHTLSMKGEPLLPNRSAPARTPPREVAKEQAPAAAAAEVPRALGDVDLVRAIRQGDDVVSRAIAIIRQHTGTEDVRFAAPSREGPVLNVRGVRVGDERNHFGELLSSTLSEAALTGWASWMHEWLLLESEYAELDRLAFTDELTGAGNRRAFERIGVAELEAARAERRQISLVAFDIDDFKVYNDRFGHDAGDAVLRETVEVVRACIRRGDHIFRIGGDEFVVLFCDPSGPRAGGAQSPESVEAVFARFQTAVGEMRLPQIGASGPGTISVSAGLATYPWDGSDLKALVHYADQLAMQSKRGGKNALTHGPNSGAPPIADL